MTFNKIAWPLLVMALCCNAAYAQNKVSKKANQIERALQEQVVKQMNKAEKKAEICKYCGEEIKSPYQHCEGKHSAGLCESEVEAKASAHKQTQEILGKAVVGEKCVLCGEEIKSPYQHCEAKHSAGLCEAASKAMTATQNTEERCTECGRTRAQVKKWGHPHKPPYLFK